MIHLFAAGLLLGASAVPFGDPIEHSVRIEHNGAPVDAQYRSKTRIVHKQVGTVAAAGRPSTLRCTWRADIIVQRDARHGSGTRLSRSIQRDSVIEGSRAGWCSTSHKAIAQEVARRIDEVRGHLIDVAQEDHPVLRGEIDRLNREG